MLSKINIFPMSTQCLVNDLTTFGKTTQVKEHPSIHDGIYLLNTYTEHLRRRTLLGMRLSIIIIKAGSRVASSNQGCTVR